ncbi:hypothetical protein ABE504_11215 [Paenibacillus oryzisoli]|uniref:hypothetical protein n=1 Tax=Paenibacillus oryzisoli TaxID=1850517 RepID=UPI003D2715CE
MKKLPIWLASFALSLGCILLTTNHQAHAVVPEESTFFSTAFVEEGSIYNTNSDGDLWPSAWSNDDYLYLANGDGWGWTNQGWSDIVFSRITSGHPDNRNLIGNRINAGIGKVWNTAKCSDGSAAYNRKPTGLTSRGGILWLAVQDLNRCPGTRFFGPTFNDAPNATILKSMDKGVTWTYNTTTPMFSNNAFTTVIFLDWGKDGVDNDPNSTRDDYIYAYGLDYNWRDSFSNSVPDPTKLYLARILATDNVQDLSKWQFWTGGLNDGAESWSSFGSIASKKPVLQDDSRVYSTTTSGFPSADIKDMTKLSQGSVTYNRALNRFIYLSWTEYTYEFYEAPAPWGPWKKFLSKDFGPYNSPWTTGKNGGYTTVMPSKYISADGKRMWFNANTFEGPVNNYNFSLRQLYVTPYNASLTPVNTKSSTNNLAVSGESKTPFTKASFHQGNPWALNDGVKNVNADDWNGEAKTESYWGYTWGRPYNLNKVVYTTGNSFPDGGWFSNGVKVQVRQNFNWVDVTGLSASPDYPSDGTAAPYKTYTLNFDDTWGDGVRIIGTPGGTAKFTTISELEVYYADRFASTVTDTFDGPLSSSWTWSAPLAGPTNALVNGNFRMSLPSTNTYDNWTTIDNAPKLTRTDMGAGDWTIETKLNLSAYTANSNFHTGLTVKFGPNNYYVWGNLQGSGLELSRSGYPALTVVPSYSNPSVYLRMRKVGQRYYADYKTNANDPWTNVSNDYYPYASPVAVGLLSKTWSNLNLTADFDYFTLSK